MKASIKNLTGMVLLVATLFSCNQGPSLQTYYVDNQEQPNFLSIDVPLSMLNLDKEQLTQDQKEAYKSIKKLNMLAYKMKPDHRADYETELAKVTSILEDPKYEELMRGGNPENGKFIIKFLGEEDDIEEFIVFGNIDGKGFAVVRVLGNEMDPNKIMTLASALDKASIDDSQLNQFTEFFK
ncbi:DUF4252 domain-containing protein [Gelidibacter salicanalis]|uniref:DUF4252 domain-containing protein n=1 Tax=Gelidibacter salicanalis TaxID=291193 RepID=A0A934KWU7_9FLAO|nr:DUF4252 domain-containing protein [Gelidibacter salicanalis]MBJ7881783.1 DUF4252 domain-containing protein [Gelidibacter salicanalis]